MPDPVFHRRLKPSRDRANACGPAVLTRASACAALKTTLVTALLLATVNASTQTAVPAADPAALLRQMTLAEKISQLQDGAPAVPRLGLPAYSWWNEALHGLARTGHATVFPQAIGLAATWNPPLLRQVGEVIAGEARAKFATGGDAPIVEGSLNSARYRGLTIWSPNINIFRDPRWGRGQETYGEDPVLTARLGVAFVQGLQGPDPARPTVIATPKHFAVHSGPERGRHAFNVSPSPFDLEDTYFPAFRATVTEGKAGSVMCAYNAIDGTPACANEALLQGRLRGDWGFKGFVVTDCDAVEDMTLFHKTTPDHAEGSARSLRAGTDLNCGRSYAALAEAVKRGRVSEADIDRALLRLLQARAQLGALSQTQPPSTPAVATDVAADQAVNKPAPALNRWLALQAARESMVLLKNDRHTLPLKADARIAVVGPTADLPENLHANYHGTARDPITPLDGLRAQFGAQRVRYAQGASFAQQVPVAVPVTALRTPEGRPGLRAEYFANAELRGRPATVRDESRLNLDYDRVAPAPGVPVQGFSVRWTGQLVPPAAGDYALGLKIDRCFDCALHDRVRVYVDGQLLIDASNPKTDGQIAALPLRLADRQPRALRVELLHSGEDQGLTLQWQPPAQPLIDEAKAAARGADAVVAFVGLSPNLEGEQLQVEVPGFDSGDRTSLDLPAAQQALLEAVKATGKPLIVVLQSGSAVALNWAAQHADAVLAAWYPGEAGGQAIAETLVGLHNPAGRLPVTFYRSAADLPAFDDYRMEGRTYRYFRGQPLWAFGHGLSYTRFAYGAPVVGGGAAALQAAALAQGQPVRVSVDLRNEGPRDGDEVVQVYLEGSVAATADGATRPKPAAPTANPNATTRTPNRALVAFQRVHLRAGESRRVELQIDPRTLARVDAQGQRTLQPGRYALAIGGGQPGTTHTVRGTFAIEGQQGLPR